MRNWIFIFACFLGGCAGTETYRSPGPYNGGWLLGPGTYLQDVSIEPQNGRTYRFEGVFRRSAESATIAGLSPFGTTVFRITDPLSPGTEPGIEIFVDEMKPHRERVAAFYRGLRPLLLLRDDPGKANPWVRERYPDLRPKLLSAGQGVELAIERYTREGRAERLVIKDPHFRAKILLREYQP